MLQNNEAVIQTAKLSKKYGRIEALKELDLFVEKNAIYGFLGPNGAGKTTTIKLLLGLIFPTSGRAKIFGRDCQKESIAIRSRIGYLSQSPIFYPYMTPRQVLQFSAGFYTTINRKNIATRVAETLALVGLTEKADRKIKGFSGGELQRLGIGQAYVHHPDLLILDEPAASLDPMGRRDVLKIMENLRDRTTIVFSTHILNDAQRVCDSLAILNKGKLITQGRMEDLLAHPDERIYSIRLKGNTGPAAQHIKSLPWVRQLKEKKGNGIVKWEVQVSDQNQAEKFLPAILTSNEISVLDWHLKENELEHIFMNLVEEK